MRDARCVPVSSDTRTNYTPSANSSTVPPPGVLCAARLLAPRMGASGAGLGCLGIGAWLGGCEHAMRARMYGDARRRAVRSRGSATCLHIAKDGALVIPTYGFCFCSAFAGLTLHLLPLQ